MAQGKPNSKHLSGCVNRKKLSKIQESARGLRKA